jgi:hypothetical protein
MLEVVRRKQSSKLELKNNLGNSKLFEFHSLSSTAQRTMTRICENEGVQEVAFSIQTSNLAKSVANVHYLQQIYSRTEIRITIRATNVAIDAMPRIVWQPVSP